MKILLLLLFFYLFIALNARAEIFIESTFIGIVKTEGYDLPNGDKFSILKDTYQWTNSLGYYETASINFLCESINQKGDKQNSIVKRKSIELQSGPSKTKIIDGTGLNKILIGTKCNYAVSYLNNAVLQK